MSDESDALEEQLPLWLAACDEALAGGTEASARPGPTVPEELRPLLEREVGWCRFVRQLWPRAAAEPLPSTLSGPGAGGQTAVLPLARLGRFDLRRELGRGAFGVVFLARDPRLGRDVALKVPRAEVLVTPELRARFRHEARAAAALDHPNIVPVYDAGEEDAVCYIAHAYCPGITLAAWLKQRTEPVPAALAARLAAQLAEAVQHAHDRGVLHRDLKPSNVMLEARSDGPAGDSLPFVPRITDFGLAKLAEGTEAASRGCQTHSGAVVGTPQYMAPEQAEGRSKWVGPAADVYALGAILYELLTGRPPFAGETMLATLELVRGEEPLAPTRLRPGVPRDLETICLHCLRKEPSGRYASARELAAELHLFLAGEPVRARPASAWERAVKWARRRPAQAGLAAVSAAAVLTVLGVVLVANGRLRQQRNLAEERQHEAEKQRRRADIYLREAHDAVDQLTRLGYESLEGVPYAEAVRRELLQEALKFHQGFARQESDDPDVRLETARAWRRLGKIQGLLGDRQATEHSYREALAIAWRLHAEFPDRPPYRYELAASLENLAGHLIPTNPAEASQAMGQALELHERLAADFPDIASYRVELAVAYHTRARILEAAGQAEDAEEAVRRCVGLLEKVVADSPSDPNLERTLAINRRDLGVFLALHKRRAEAEPLFRRDLDFWEKQASQAPAVPRYQARAGDAAYHLGNLLVEAGHPRDGEGLLRRAIERRQQLVDEYPRVPGYQGDLASAQELVARLLRERGDFAEAALLLEQAVQHVRAVRKADPRDARQPGLLSSFTWLLADCQLQLGHYRDAARLAEELPGIVPQSWRECYQATRLLTRSVPLAKSDGQLGQTMRDDLVEHYSRRAVEWLREAFRRGYTNSAFVQSDHGLDVLREREDFRQLLSDAARKP
jgi:tetratricopeptide (TPR) repeat protein/tRNA A-37 threonylcarbamoyl transferase component Bud32